MTTNNDTKNNDEQVVEASYRMTQRGLWYVSLSERTKEGDGKPIWSWLSPPFIVKARTLDTDGKWGKALEWINPDGETVSWVLDAKLLGGDPKAIWQAMYESGLEISPDGKARGLLLRYLVEQKPKRRARVVDRLGWTDDDCTTFVLPDAAYGADTGIEFIYRGGATNPYTVKGTTAEWRDSIGVFCRGNARMMLCVSIGFAGPLLAPANEESGGIHFIGGSRDGKTTCTMVGASVGGDPKEIVMTYRATANGLEGHCAQRSDGLLALDEIGLVSPIEAGEVAYMIANSKGKSRMRRDTTARKALSWRVLFMSTGEMTLADKMSEAKKTIKAGQEIRLLNVLSDAGAGMGVFENLHGFPVAGAFSDEVRSRCGQYHGAPFRTFLEHLVTQFTPLELRATVTARRAEFIAHHVPPGASGQVRSAAGRFGVIAAAGELATIFGVTGWEVGEATKAASTCFHAWLGERGTAGDHDLETGIKQVLAYIETYGNSRFQDLGIETAGQIVHTRVGFRRFNSNDGRIEYMVMANAWKDELCKSYRAKDIAEELARRGILVRRSGRLDQNRKLGQEGQHRVYVLVLDEPDTRTPQQRRHDIIESMYAVDEVGDAVPIH